MNASQVFYQTFDHITKTVDKIFSLGFDQPKHFFSWSAPLFVLGKLAKYVIGFPLAFILSSIIWIIIVVNKPFNIKMNLPANNLAYHNHEDSTAVKPFKNNQSIFSQPINSHHNKTTLEDKPLSATESLETAKYTSPEPTNTQSTVTKTTKISQEALQDKKNELHRIINLVIKRLEEKIDWVKPEYESHRKTLEDHYQLKSELAYEKNLAAYAKKFSHNTIKKEMVAGRTRCLCGDTGYYGTCRRCHLPVYSIEIEKMVPVYIPDEDRRDLARLNVKQISEKIVIADDTLKATLSSYKLGQALYFIVRRLQSLQKDTDSTITKLFTRFKNILDEALPYFIDDESFKKNDFMPRSQYSQIFVASKMTSQLQRSNQFFKMLPEELIEKIIAATVTSNFPERIVRDIARLTI